MINLLPEAEKIELKMRGVKKRILVILIFVLILLIILTLILLSLQFYLSFKTDSVHKELQQTESSLQSFQFHNLKKIIEKTNSYFAAFTTFYNNQIFLAPILEKLANLTPETIYFTNFSFRKKVEKEDKEKEQEIFAEIHITGFVKTREDLFFFKKDLESQDEFKDIYFSPSSWVSPNNITFSLSFKFNLQ